ncbi:hypothetical protein E2542_SST06848 [Spatholobus suberectus]|nr:hypothetical protein E2542_SST06848 [Spatholobus suberectus]
MIPSLLNALRRQVALVSEYLAQFVPFRKFQQSRPVKVSILLFTHTDTERRRNDDDCRCMIPNHFFEIFSEGRRKQREGTDDEREWPTPGLWPGVVGRKASTYPFKLLAIVSNWFGFATAPFVVLVAVLIALMEIAFGDLVLAFKPLPSMQSSSYDRNNSTKSKQVRVKCAMMIELKGSNVGMRK